MTSLRIANTLTHSYKLFSVVPRRTLISTTGTLKKWKLFERGFSSKDSIGKLLLNIDDSAIERLKVIGLDENQFLRVLVEGGGCSGFQYKFEIDSELDNEEDLTFEKDNVKVVADLESVKILNGAKVEYHQDLIRAGFRVVDIPQAEKGCSCGVSFSVKL